MELTSVHTKINRNKPTRIARPEYKRNQTAVRTNKLAELKRTYPRIIEILNVLLEAMIKESAWAKELGCLSWSTGQCRELTTPAVTESVGWKRCYNWQWVPGKTRTSKPIPWYSPGPECRPNLMSRSAVSGPKVPSSLILRRCIFRRHSRAKRHIAIWWSRLGLGRPVAAT